MSEEPTKIAEPTTEITSTLTANPTTTTPGVTTSTLTPTYGSSMYSSPGLLGGGMYGGGMYGTSMLGGGMYGGGMYGASSLLNRNQPNSFRQEYQGVLQGLRSAIQMGFSTFGLITYGKIFSSMVLNMIKFVFRKTRDTLKYLVGVIIFNRYSTKIMNGVFRKIQDESSPRKAVLHYFFRGLVSIGMLGIALMWFMLRRNSLDEQVAVIQRNMRRRRKMKEMRMLKMKQYQEDLQRVIDEQLEKRNSEFNLEAQKAFQEAIEEDQEKEDLKSELSKEAEEKLEEESAKSTVLKKDSQQSLHQSKSEIDIEDGQNQINQEINDSDSQEEPISLTRPTEQPVQNAEKNNQYSEEFWTKMHELVHGKQVDEGQVLRNLFEDNDDDDDEAKHLFDKYKAKPMNKEESNQFAEDILTSWPTFEPPRPPTPKVKPIFLEFQPSPDMASQPTEDTETRFEVNQDAEDPLGLGLMKSTSLNFGTSTAPTKPWLLNR